MLFLQRSDKVEGYESGHGAASDCIRNTAIFSYCNGCRKPGGGGHDIKRVQGVCAESQEWQRLLDSANQVLPAHCPKAHATTCTRCTVMGQ